MWGIIQGDEGNTNDRRVGEEGEPALFGYRAWRLGYGTGLFGY